MLPCSVTASAGIFNLAASSRSSSMRHAPSRRENSVWRWRCTNSLIPQPSLATSHGDAETRSIHKVSISVFSVPPWFVTAMSLPFDRRRRLRRNIVDDAIDPTDFVDDARGNRGEEVVREARPVGGHPVKAFD